MSKNFASSKYYISVTLSNSKTLSLAHGEPVERLLKLAVKNENCIGFGINCVSGSKISTFVDKFFSYEKTSRLNLIIKPNDGKIWDGVNHKWIEPSASKPMDKIESWLPDLKMKWENNSSTTQDLFLGGCCGTLAGDL